MINRITLSLCVPTHPEVLHGKVAMRRKGPVASERELGVLDLVLKFWKKAIF